MNNGSAVCPVCGSAAAPAAAHAGVCSECSCEYAYASLFSSEESLALWRSLTAEKKRQLILALQGKCRDCFSLSGGAVAYTSPADGHLWLMKDGEAPVVEDAVRYSAAENTGRNEAFLKADGSVISFGDDACAQCGTEELRNIRRVLALADCTYALKEDGGIACCGHPLSPEIAAWRNVRDFAAGNYMAALTSDGRVLVAGELINPRVANEVSGWSDIVKVVVGGDAIIGLRSDSTVVFAGREDDKRAACRSWSGVADIAIDSVYAIGLTTEGGILLAGEINDYLDMGRTEARSWDEIVAVFARGSGIGALKLDGTVKLAGNIRNIDRLREVCAAQRQRLHADIMSKAAK